MRENPSNLIGREESLEFLEENYRKAREEGGQTVFIQGEAGIGKTHLVEYFIEGIDVRKIKAECLPNFQEPLVPVKRALKDTEMEHLISKKNPRVLSTYLMSEGGMVITKAERDENGLDGDIFGSMLSMVEDFVQESLGDIGSEEGGVNSISYQDYDIILQREDGLTLATVIEGEKNEFLIKDMGRTLSEIDGSYSDWDGNMKKAEELEPDISWFIESGKYEGSTLTEDPKIKKENLFDNILLGLQRLSRKEPIVLFLDDLQWADPTTLSLLHYLSRNLRDSSVMMIGTYRPEDVLKEETTHPLRETVQEMKRKELATELKLDRLEKGQVRELLEYSLDDSGMELLEKVYEESEGNPLFVLEIARYLDEEGVPDGESLEGRLEDTPLKIYDIIQRRLNRLSERVYEVLEAAAVIGEKFRSEVLARTLNKEKFSVVKILSRVERKHKLLISSENEYRFDHSKVREILYENMNQELRREYHRKVAESYLEIEPKRVEEAGHHFYEAEDERGVEFLKDAAEDAAENYSNEEAIEKYRRALELEKDPDIQEDLGDVYTRIGEYDDAVEEYRASMLNGGPRAELKRKIAFVYNKTSDFDRSRELTAEGLEMVENDTERAKLLRVRGWTDIKTGEYDSAQEYLLDALNLCKELEKAEELAESYNALGTLSFNRCDYDRSIEYFREALSNHHDLLGVSKTYNNLGNVYDDLGELNKALEYYEKSLDISRKIGENYNIAASLNNLGIIHWEKGDLESVLEYQQEALKIFEKMGSKRTTAILLNNVGNVYQDKGDLREALKNYREALQIAEDMDYEMGTLHPLTNIGAIKHERGKFKESEEYLEQSLSLCEEKGEKQHSITNLCKLASLYIDMDRLEEALERSEEALDISRELGAKTKECKSLRTLGVVKRELNDLEKSEQMMERALSLAEDSEMKDERARILYELGVLREEQGNDEEKRELLDRAFELFKDTGKEFWMEKVKEKYEN